MYIRAYGSSRTQDKIQSKLTSVRPKPPTSSQMLMHLFIYFLKCPNTFQCVMVIISLKCTCMYCAIHSYSVCIEPMFFTCIRIRGEKKITHLRGGAWKNSVRGGALAPVASPVPTPVPLKIHCILYLLFKCSNNDFQFLIIYEN